MCGARQRVVAAKVMARPALPPSNRNSNESFRIGRRGVVGTHKEKNPLRVVSVATINCTAGAVQFRIYFYMKFTPNE